MTDFTQQEPWRVFRIMSEFVEGLDELAKLGASVSIFGSSRLPSDSKYCQMAQTLARALVHQGFAVITGAGPSVMEAANRGALEAGRSHRAADGSMVMTATSGADNRRIGGPHRPAPRLTTSVIGPTR